LKLDAVPFDLDATLCCGQVFRWQKRGGWWFGVVGNRVFKARQDGKTLEFLNVDEEFVTHYFSLDHDLKRVGREIGRDEHVKAALRQFWGLRIVRQPPWECLISFICATYKNVAAIMQMLNKLSARFGDRVVFEGDEFFTFPTPEALASASKEELLSCGLGYRANYVRETSRMIDECVFDLGSLRGVPYEQAKKRLCELPGVGAKVADCVLLFSLDRLEAFPVDVWVKRVLLKYYAECLPAGFVERVSSRESLSNSDYEVLNRFGREYFGEYAGYAQEYLYHYERVNRSSC
jgi:N-glycosylase/DNA lyase